MQRLVTVEKKNANVWTIQWLRLARIRRYKNVDKTWIDNYTPEVRQQSIQRVSAGEPAPKKGKTVKSAGNLMAVIVRDARGITLRDNL